MAARVALHTAVVRRAERVVVVVWEEVELVVRGVGRVEIDVVVIAIILLASFGPLFLTVIVQLTISP